MNIIVLIIVLILLFGGGVYGGQHLGYGWYGYGGGLVGVLVVLLICRLLGLI